MAAVWLYAHGFSFRAIAKFLKVVVSTVYVWVKKYAKENYKKEVIIELDEMWHYLQ
jgi:transposase